MAPAGLMIAVDVMEDEELVYLATSNTVLRKVNWKYYKHINIDKINGEMGFKNSLEII